MPAYPVPAFTVQIALDEHDYDRLAHQAARYGYTPHRLIDTYIEAGLQEHELIEAEEQWEAEHDE